MRRLWQNRFFKFAAVTLIFFIVTSPFIVLFGPFGNLKRAVVGAIMRSRHPQYITWLFDQDQLDQILGGVSRTPEQKFLKFTARTDSTIRMQKIEANRFVGYLLEIPNPKRIQVATAEDINEKGDTTSNIARRRTRWRPSTGAASTTRTAPARAGFPTALSCTKASTSWAGRWATRSGWTSSA